MWKNICTKGNNNNRTAWSLGTLCSSVFTVAEQNRRFCPYTRRMRVNEEPYSSIFCVVLPLNRQLPSKNHFLLNIDSSVNG